MKKKLLHILLYIFCIISLSNVAMDKSPTSLWDRIRNVTRTYEMKVCVSDNLTQHCDLSIKASTNHDSSRCWIDEAVISREYGIKDIASTMLLKHVISRLVHDGCKKVEMPEEHYAEVVLGHMGAAVRDPKTNVMTIAINKNDLPPEYVSFEQKVKQTLGNVLFFWRHQVSSTMLKHVTRVDAQKNGEECSLWMHKRGDSRTFAQAMAKLYQEGCSKIIVRSDKQQSQLQRYEEASCRIDPFANNRNKIIMAHIHDKGPDYDFDPFKTMTLIMRVNQSAKQCGDATAKEDK